MDKRYENYSLFDYIDVPSLNEYVSILLLFAPVLIVGILFWNM